MRITFLGAAGTVTGSKYLVESDGRRVLVDCGLFQGDKELRTRNWQPLPIRASSIDAVVLTHAHLDHSGYLPILVRDGFAGRIFCSAATADLCAVLLRDAAHIQEEDAEHANRHRYSKHRPAAPLYTERDAVTAVSHLTAVPWSAKHYLGGGVDITLDKAGHMLGAATVRLRADGTELLFSGDLGRANDPLFAPPAAGGGPDYLVVESTYGDRLHGPSDGSAELAEVVRQTAQRGGVVVIPSFAIGRAQLVLHHLFNLRSSGEIPDVPVFLNSPMAIDAGEIFCRHPGDHRLAPDACRGMCNIAQIIRTVDESRALNQRSGPMIIVSASGMLTGGRVLHHIKAFGGDRRNTILLVGYQAAGTRGRALQNGAPSLRIHGEDVAIRAQVSTLPSLSAHADAGEIVAWLSTFSRAPKRTFVTHGEPAASRALASRIEKELGWSAEVPVDGESIELEGADHAPPPRQGAATAPPAADPAPCCNDR